MQAHGTANQISFSYCQSIAAYRLIDRLVYTAILKRENAQGLDATDIAAMGSQ